MDQEEALVDFKYLALRLCAMEGADCTNPLYEEWEIRYHACMRQETQVDPENTQDDFCQTHKDCAAGLCCGLATSYDEGGFELGYIHVCNDKNAAEWMDHEDWRTFYTFKCL